MIQAAFIFGIALLCFIEDADQLLERINIGHGLSPLDEVSIVSIAPTAQPSQHNRLLCQLSLHQRHVRFAVLALLPQPSKRKGRKKAPRNSPRGAGVLVGSVVRIARRPHLTVAATLGK